MINSKNYLLVIVPYFFMCSGLFHLVYWGSFNINGLSLISTGNVIKSAISPMIYTFGGAGLGIILAHITTKKWESNDSKKHSFGIENTAKKQANSSVKIGPLFLGLGLSSLFVYILSLKTGLGNDWRLYCYFVGIVIYNITNPALFFADFKTTIDKRLLWMMLIYFPCFCVGHALDKAGAIRDNRSFEYTIIQHAPADTLKLLGITDQHFIFITKDNSRKYFITGDTIQLWHQ